MQTIRRTFRDKVILITGATGFVGQPLVAKILTHLSNIKKIYLLIRRKTGRNGSTISAHERLESKFFPSDVFNHLRQVHGENFDSWIRGKVFAVEGDLNQDRLGLSDSDYQRLTEEVQILINSAAIVEFDSPIDDAVQMNVISAQRAVELAKSCPNAVFVHISTAYSCGSTPGKVPEELHLSYADIAKQLKAEGENAPATIGEELDQMLSAGAEIRSRTEWSSPELKSELVESGLNHAKSRGWNDIYTYTKYLGEQIVTQTCDGLSVAIVRPSIIESSLKEPEPGWLDGLRMADPLIIGYGKGRLLDFPAKPDILLDVIPVDLVVNAIIAAASEAIASPSVQVYHVSSGATNPLFFQVLYDATKAYFHQHPMEDRDGQSIVPHEWKFRDLAAFNRYFASKQNQIESTKRWLKMAPFKWASRKSRQLSVVQNSLERLLYYVKIYGAYVRLSYEFETGKTQALHQSLTAEEQQLFNFDASNFDWKHYLQQVHIPGIKRFVLRMEGSSQIEKQTVETSPPIKGKGERKKAIPELFQTIPDLLSYQTQKAPNHVALQIKRNDKWIRYTYQQFDQLSKKIAQQLCNSGYRHGDRILLWADNQPEWGIAYFACAQIGVIVVPIDRQTPVTEAYALAKFTEAKAIFTTSDIADGLNEIESTTIEYSQHNNSLVEMLEIEVRDIGSECRLVGTEEDTASPARSPESAAIPSAEIKPETIASIIFTSGTAYDPKGVMLSHRNFIANVLSVAEALPPQPGERFLSVLPLYHALEFTCGFLMSIYSGSTVTYLNSLRPNAILDTMRETETTVMIGVPRLFKLIYDSLMRYVVKVRPNMSQNQLTTDQIEQIHQALGGKLRILVSGGSALPDTVYDNYLQLGITLYQGYGLTETAPVVSVNPYQKSRRSSVGTALNDVQIEIDQLNADGIGEVIIRSPSLMSGYFNNPKATEKVLPSDTLYSGDLGYFDSDGYLYLTGRSKDVIVSGAGKNIYPGELEVLYGAHNNIQEICIIGQSTDDEIGEEVHAVVLPTSLDAEPKIRQHIRSRANALPSYQRVHKIHTWPITTLHTEYNNHSAEELPKTEAGKIDRELIKLVLASQFTDQANPRFPGSRAVRDQVENKPNREYYPPVEAAQLGQDVVDLAQLSEPERLLPPTVSVDSGVPQTQFDRIVAELARIARLPVNQIQPSTDLDADLGLDSLMKIELLLLLEGELGQPLPDELVVGIKTVDDIIRVTETVKQLSSETESPSSTQQLGDQAPTEFSFEAEIPETVDLSIAKIFRFGMRVVYDQVFSIQCRGLENIPKGEKYIIAANHSSHLDTGAIMTVLEKESKRLKVLGARDYFFTNPFKSWFFGQLMNVLPLDRTENFLQGVRTAQEALDQGYVLLIYPEGTRSMTGELQEFRAGLGLLACEAKVPIIPTCIKGAYQALPKGQNLPHPNQIQVSFGNQVQPIINTSSSAHEQYKEIANHVRAAIVKLQEVDDKLRSD